MYFILYMHNGERERGGERERDRWIDRWIDGWMDR
jgi:hypothetical protein